MDKGSEHFSRDEIQVANRYTRSWEMRTKATIRIISHLSDWLLSKRQKDTSCWPRCGEKGTWWNWVECKLVQSLQKHQYGGSSKI